jgi:hypothetical protein
LQEPSVVEQLWAVLRRMVLQALLVVELLVSEL